MSDKPSSKKRKLAFYAITYTVLFLFLFILGEVVVRIALRSYSIESLRKRSLVYSPTNITRYVLAPNQTMEVDGKPKYKINEYGYRGTPFSVPKQEGVVRIIILGGSAVFDQNVKEGEDWPHLVQKHLHARGYENIEVVNAGIPGYTSFDSVGRLYGQIWMYDPDYLLLYNAWNDIKYFQQVSPPKSILTWRLKYTQIVDPRLHYQGALDRLLNYSELYAQIRVRYYDLVLNVGNEGIIPEGAYAKDYTQWAPKQYQINMELFVDSSRNIGATPILMTQATLVNAENSVDEMKHINYDYQKLTHQALVKAYEECNNIVKNVGREKKVKLIDVAAIMSGQKQFFSDHVHLTSAGGARIAKMVAQFLEKEIVEKYPQNEESISFLLNQ